MSELSTLTPPAQTREHNLAPLLNRQQVWFQSGATRSARFRRQQLNILADGLKQYESRINEALRADLRKPAFEVYASEVGFLLDEIRHIRKHLKRWMRPTRVATPITQMISSAWVSREPWGSALIIAPWNYPLQLLLSPAAGAIAGGNCAVLKPSELAPHTSSVVAEMIGQLFAPEYIAVVEGGIETNQELLALPFNYIFFTGSPRVGQIVMEAAARQLIPVTLELGGKSPCIVDASVDIKVAAARIAWGKFFNNGQTCIAPDYILVDQEVQEPLIEALKSQIEKFYGPDPLQSPDYGRIINDRHFSRLRDYLDQGRIRYGGQVKADERYLAPTLLTDVSPESPVMQDEIFGPILPILSWQKLEEAIDFVRSRPKPLALYVFTQRSQTERQVLDQLQFGGGCVNDTLVHLTSPDLPFGGVGTSGIGSYHGHHSFQTFTQPRSILKKSIFPDMPIRYAPYTRNKLNLVKRLMG